MLRVINRRAGMRTHELLKRPRRGCWIDLEAPSRNELESIAKLLEIAPEELASLLDEREPPKLEKSKQQVVVTVLVPYTKRKGMGISTLTILIKDGYLITLHKRKLAPIDDFLEGRVKQFQTDKRLRLLIQLLARIVANFVTHLKLVEKSMERAEGELFTSMRPQSILDIWEVRRTIIQLNDAVMANDRVLTMILRGRGPRLYKEDRDVIGDLVLESRHLTRVLSLYTELLTNTMDAYVSLISNNLNIVMKRLTSLAMIAAVPTILSSLYGMNVRLPFAENPNAFSIILLLSVILSLLLLVIFKRLDWI